MNYSVRTPSAPSQLTLSNIQTQPSGTPRSSFLCSNRTKKWSSAADHTLSLPYTSLYTRTNKRVRYHHLSLESVLSLPSKSTPCFRPTNGRKDPVCPSRPYHSLLGSSIGFLNYQVRRLALCLYPRQGHNASTTHLIFVYSFLLMHHKNCQKLVSMIST